MKKLFLSLLSILSLSLGATHNRAGEITYRWLGGLTYEVTITTYTRSCQFCADRCELTINWGDGNDDVLPRINGSNLRCGGGARDGVIIDAANEIRFNQYRGVHTYSAPGPYILSVEDQNRNAGVNNIINSDQVPFYVETELFISPSLGGDNSPELTNPPIDRGCIGRRFIHNAGAFDPDGDSLAYRLVDVKTQNGIPLTTTYDANFVQDSVRIDASNGDFIWDAPRQAGQFNFAFEILSFRKNSAGRFVYIGRVTRDMQVNIESCGNNPPVVDPIGPFCVEAGSRLEFSVRASDPDNDNLTLSAFGGPLVINPSPASFTEVSGPSPVQSTFRWDTRCEHVRQQDYQVSFRAEDIPARPFEVPLTDMYTASITVVAPAPQNPSVVSEGRGLRLNWDPSICREAEGYLIYRREGAYGFVPSECELGVPAYTGYRFLDSNRAGRNAVSYLDTQQLQIGMRYCYMVVAYFADGAQSYASEEFCASLPLDRPLITQVDVQATGRDDGAIRVAWLAPPVLDSGLFPPPYRYELERSDSLEGRNYQNIASLPGLGDTAWLDEDINTQSLPYNYRVALFSGSPASLVGRSSPASSIFLESIGLDRGMLLRYRDAVPWSNQRWVIYRENASGTFDSIGESFQSEYRDTGLVNGQNYCYYVEAYGRYTADDSLPAPLINRSQIACAAARDTVPPCAPRLELSYQCPDSLFISWELDRNPGCKQNVVQINVYYRTGTNSFGSEPLYSFRSRGDSVLRLGGEEARFGCYAISAVDDADLDPGGVANESPLSEERCTQSCFSIEFPNAFTPNGDGQNDLFLPIELREVSELRLAIYNRWGGLIYQAQSLNEYLNAPWDGTVQRTGNPASDGVYYYIVQYVPESLGPRREQELTGFVHLFR